MIISKTPLRVSLVGGGTDLKSYYSTGYGAVLSMTIDKNIYVTINRRFDDSIRVSYTQTEIVNSVDEIKHDLVRECMRMVGIEKGVEITTIGDVPAGTGLGSSSTLTVGLLNALYTYCGVTMSAEELQRRACQIEIDILGNPIGKQDQSAAAFGGVNYIRFNADESVERDHIILPDSAARCFEHNAMIFYTGIQRSANDILAKQNADTPNKLDILGQMRDQAAELRELFRRGDVGPELGHILDRGWQLKRSVTGAISNPAIDEMYEKAKDAGAIGGKLLGAGGGGFLLLYVEDENQQRVSEALGLKRMFYSLSRYGSRIVYFNN